METEITCDWIDRYNEGELNDTEKDLFQRRMVTNPILRSEVSIDESLNKFLADEDLLDLMKKIRAVTRKTETGTVMMNRLLIAASVLCLFMIGALYILLRTSMNPAPVCTLQHEEKPVGKKVEQPGNLENITIPANSGSSSSLLFYNDIHKGLLAQNFEPLAEFELLVGSVTRSYQFKLISPGVNLSVSAGTEVHFAWRNEDRLTPVCIEILNNLGIPEIEIPLKQGSSYTLKTNGLREGLYYWKIIIDDEMVLMGKLTIL